MGWTRRFGFGVVLGRKIVSLTVALALVATIAVPGGVAPIAAKPKELVRVSTYDEGPLEGQDGWSTLRRGNDGGYVVTSSTDYSGGKAVSNTPDIDPTTGATISPPPIYRSVDPSPTPGFSVHMRMGDVGAPGAGVRLHAEGDLGLDATTAVAEANADSLGRLKIRFPYAPTMRSVVFLDPEFEPGTWLEVHVDIASDGRAMVCAFPQAGDFSPLRLYVGISRGPLPRLEDGSMPTIDTLAFFHAAVPGLPSAEAQWGSVFTPDPQGSDGRPCPGILDDFEAYAAGSELAGQGGWSGDAGFILAQEILADGTVNRYVDPSTNDKRDVDLQLFSVTPKASVGLSLRSGLTTEPGPGFYLANQAELDATGDSFLDVLLDENAKVTVVGPDGTKHALPGEYVAGSFFDVFVDLDTESRTADVCWEDRILKMLPGKRKWSGVQLNPGSSPTSDLDSVGLFQMRTSTVKADWDNLGFFSTDLDLCPLFREDFEPYEDGSRLDGQGGWTADPTFRVRSGGAGQHVNAAGGGSAHRAVERSPAHSFGAEISLNDLLQPSGGLYIGDSMRGTTPEDSFFAVFFDFGGDLAYTLDGESGTIRFGDGKPGARLPTQGSSYGMLVDLDATLGTAEICVRQPADASGIRVYDYGFVSSTADPSSPGFDTHGMMYVTTDPVPAGVDFDDVVQGAGDGDLCPVPATFRLTPTGLRGSDGWFRGTTDVAVSCSRGIDWTFLRERARINGADVPVRDPWVVTLIAGEREGTNTVEALCEMKEDYWAYDSVSVMIDSVPPATTPGLAGTPGSDGWWRSAVRVDPRCSDATSGCRDGLFRMDGTPVACIWVKMPDGTWACGDGIPPLFVADGTHTLEFHSTDVAANVESVRTLPVLIDQTPPMTGVSVPPPDGLAGWYVSKPTLTFDPRDATSGIRKTFIDVDGRVTTLTGNAFTIEDDGDHEVRVWSEDVAGNVETARVLRVPVDTTPPEVELTSPKKGCVYPETGSFCTNLMEKTVVFVVSDHSMDVDASDATSGVARVEFFVDEPLRATDPVAPYMWPWPAGDEALGDHVVLARAHDVAGNQADTARLTVTTAPSSVAGLLKTVEDGVLLCLPPAGCIHVPPE